MKDETPERIWKALTTKAGTLRAIVTMLHPKKGLQEELRLTTLKIAYEEYLEANAILLEYLKDVVEPEIKNE
jgi:hypothetical protein